MRGGSEKRFVAVSRGGDLERSLLAERRQYALSGEDRLMMNPLDRAMDAVSRGDYEAAVEASTQAIDAKQSKTANAPIDPSPKPANAPMRGRF